MASGPRVSDGGRRRRRRDRRLGDRARSSLRRHGPRSAGFDGTLANVARRGMVDPVVARRGRTPRRVSTPGFCTKDWFPVTLPSTVLGGPRRERRVPRPLPRNPPRERLGAAVPGSLVVPHRVRAGRRAGRADAAALRRDQLPGRHLRERNARRGLEIGSPARSARTRSTSPTWSTPGTNALAVRVYPVDPDHDLTITWIDWSPLAPDHGMGIWHDVWLTRTGGVTVSDPQVVSDLPLARHGSSRSHGDGDRAQRRRRRPWTADVAGTIGTICVLPDRRARRGGVEARDVRSGGVPAAPSDRPAGLVAVPDGGPTAGGADHDRVGRTAWSRIGASTSFGIREVTSGVHAERRAAIPDQRQADPDPRRRVGVGHAAPPGARSRRRPADVRARHGTEHGPVWRASWSRITSSTRPIGWGSWSCPAGCAATTGSSRGSGPPTRQAIARASMTSQADPDAQPPERVHVHDRERHQTGPGRAARCT